ncbi:glycosyltransferase [Agromyces sp. Q22]|uniref:Glycosyltransferase n=1 Tax=Agromyces kandeliae TaxID=2666141 RepID=A0A6L5QZ17_9MICO|nr:glycosyltransferase [Agromyces kandeliae]
MSPNRTESSAPGVEGVIADHLAICDGAKAAGPQGTVVFCVSTDDPAEGKGDLFVALGLARALSRNGWGVRLWPMSRWNDPLPDADVVVSMIESFVPGGVAAGTVLLGWVRNWTERWVELPFLAAFDGFLASSAATAEEMRARYDGPIGVLPIGVDTDLFDGAAEAPRPVDIVTTANFWGAERELQGAIDSVSEHHRIDWYGQNAEHLDLPDGIVHRGSVPFEELPAVYGSAKLVLDDLIRPAKAFGNHNSRLFEALACGALPITNTSSGLAELGLSDVPSYGGETTLVEVVDGLLADDTGREAVAGRLRAIVRDRHSYAARAESFEAFIAPVRSAGRRQRPDWLGWATEVRESLRTAEFALDETRSGLHAEQQRTRNLRSELDQTHARLNEVATRLRAIETHPVYRTLSKAARVAKPVPRPARKDAQGRPKSSE